MLRRLRFARATYLAKLARSRTYRIPGRATLHQQKFHDVGKYWLAWERSKPAGAQTGSKLCILVLCQYLTTSCVMIRACITEERTYIRRFIFLDASNHDPSIHRSISSTNRCLISQKYRLFYRLLALILRLIQSRLISICCLIWRFEDRTYCMAHDRCRLSHIVRRVIRYAVRCKHDRV